MASSSKFLTIPGMEKIEVDSVTSEATGYPGEQAFDHNLDLYWKPTSTASQTWVLDLQAAKQIDGMVLWCHNYDTDHGNSGNAEIAIHVGSTDNGSTWDDLVINPTVASVQTVGDPIIHLDFSSSRTKRYWRFWMSGTWATIFELSMLFMYLERSVAIGNAWPEVEHDVFHNSVQRSRAGRMFVTRHSRNYTSVIGRTWEAIGATPAAAIQNAYRDSKGSAFPLIFNEGTDYWAVRFLENEFKLALTDYEVYGARVAMATLPYVEDGEVY